jgi:hypothetical protein
MDVQAYAYRAAIANERMMVAAKHIADLAGIPAPELTSVSRNPQYAALFEREAVTTFLEALEVFLQQPEPAKEPEPSLRRL